ncbi:hypothetical protein AAFF_G00272720 [Aldrovandia affinis]|uniref:C2H2-type domain-containing protein n=1 Tax=Aldrovandia affinis TaxID=143900 RepID=A0AAD7W277_9TELE|nr:hypothetical protein AAFF_G00272720 [Aldrovandia affinis]
MTSKRAYCDEVGVSGMISPNSLNSINAGSSRKQGTLGSPMRNSGQCFELKGEKIELVQPVFCETKLSISSLKIRLAPTIQNTLATAVDSLLNEMAAVLDDAMTKTQQELVTRDQENLRLKLRLEVSEGELKALQECLCSAQKIIDQLPVSFPGLATLGPQDFASSPGPCASVGSTNAMHRESTQSFSRQHADGRDAPCLHACSAELGGSFNDAAMRGFGPGDEPKVCPLSIQADGTVTNHLLDTFATSSPSHWPNVSRPASDECASEQRVRHSVQEERGASPSGPGSRDRVEIKQEREQGAGPQGHGAGAGDAGVAGGRGAECEQTAQNVAELGYIHVVEEEDASRSRPSRPSPPSQQGPPRGSGDPKPQPDNNNSPQNPAAQPGTRPGPATSWRGPPTHPPTSTPPPSGRRPAADPAGGERPHLCLECGKTFRLISSLKKHVRIHTGEKPYPCGVCGRCFRESGALKTHQRIHTGEKPYSCADCGTSFRHLDGLRKHRRTHTGEKPYACAVCGKRLSRLQHLKHHQRIHTGERPCRCPHCHKSFKEPAALRKHLRTHREEPGAGGGAGGGAGAGGAAGSLAGGGANINRLLYPTLPPTQMGLGAWGPDGEDAGVMHCV